MHVVGPLQLQPLFLAGLAPFFGCGGSCGGGGEAFAHGMLYREARYLDVCYRGHRAGAKPVLANHPRPIGEAWQGDGQGWHLSANCILRNATGPRPLLKPVGNCSGVIPYSFCGRLFERPSWSYGSLPFICCAHALALTGAGRRVLYQDVWQGEGDGISRFSLLPCPLLLGRFDGGGPGGRHPPGRRGLGRPWQLHEPRGEEPPLQ